MGFIPGIVASQMTSSLVMTETPSIMSVVYTPPFKVLPAGYSMTVRNNDTSTASIYASIGVNPPTDLMGSAAYNSTINFILEGAAAPQVLYVRAQASGKDFSLVNSYFQDI